MVCSTLHLLNDPEIPPPGWDEFLNVHFVMPRSEAHGPGTRCVVWVQGCTLACPGCCNPSTHSAAQGAEARVEEILEKIEKYAPYVDGVTLSGGEPMQQAEAVLALLEGIRARTNLSVLLSSGYELAEIQGQPLGPRILDFVDVLIAGRFERDSAVEN